MQNYIDVLKQTQLFATVDEKGIFAMLDCLQATLSFFKKGEYVIRQGEHSDNVMLLVSGSLHIQKEDYWGNLSIVNRVGVGELFGEAYIAPDSGTLSNDVVTVEDSAVIFFDIKKIISSCGSACKYHTLVMQNLFFALAEKNRKLVQKLEHMSNRSTRQKLMSYLSEQAAERGNTFTIPFNRQQLADFLAVDRSAMSNELSKMRRDGLIDYHKNKFSLL